MHPDVLGTISEGNIWDFHGGEMEIEYTLDVNQTIVGRNRFYIRVQEPKQSHTGDIRWPI